MPNLSIKDVPEPWAAALRQRAARHHRSLQGELMAIIEQALQAVPAAPAGLPPAVASSFVNTDRQAYPSVRRGSKTIEQIAKEQRKMFPKPVRGGPLAVDIIREERDAR
jgi:plasmid stability protein